MPSVLSAHRKHVRRSPLWIKSCKESSSGFAKFNCQIHIAYPFAGIGGPMRAMVEAEEQWPSVACNIIENDPKLMPMLQRILPTDAPRVQVTDASKMKFSSLEPSQVMFGTAPCQTFSMLGSKHGANSKRGDLFFTQLKMAKHLRGNKGPRRLKICVFEEVWTFTSKMQVGSALAKAKKWWATNMPDFTELNPWKIDCLDTDLAQQRIRCIMVSVEHDFAMITGGEPEPPPKHQRRGLEEFLQATGTEGRTRAKGLSTSMASNVAFAQATFDAKNTQKLIVIDASRRPELKFKASIGIDYSTLLTTKNMYLYIVRPKNAESTSVPKPGRLMFLEERAKLSGVHWQSIAGTASNRTLAIALGNMIPVDMAGCVLNQIFLKWEKYESYIISSGLRGMLEADACSDSDDE
jgi:site-specific DNA-cytosine methylase